MLKYIVTVLLVVASSASVLESALACGDKFLVPGRVPQFEQAYAAHDPGRVLMYRNEASDVARKVLNDDLKRILERVGHHVEVVRDADELKQALGSNSFDVVLVDAQDVGIVQEHGGAVLLPVVYKAPWTEVERLKERYSAVMNAPSHPSRMVSAVEAAMAMRRGID